MPAISKVCNSKAMGGANTVAPAADKTDDGAGLTRPVLLRAAAADINVVLVTVIKSATA